MAFPLVTKWQVYSVKSKIDKLTRKIFHGMSSDNDQLLEYGNIRRSREWGILRENIVQWVILVDIIIGKPVQYIIAYSLVDKKYSCYATTDKEHYSNVFQFSTTDLHELDFRLQELANHIPSLRERWLREYLYNESKNTPGRRWLKFFTGRGKMEVYLNGKIENLYNQGRISKKEMTRLHTYITNLV
jgi:hypothetical protein